MNFETDTRIVKVRHIEISNEQSGQRIDNFLFTQLKGVPKTLIYRVIRKGEVRVNKGRINNKYRLQAGDIVRIPPVRTAIRNNQVVLQPRLKVSLEKAVLFEDESLLVIDKPAGFAVHGGTGISSGVIEALRVLRPEHKFLELAHRLDKDTSGCLIVAKKRKVLNALHDLFRQDAVEKTYLALLAGEWQRKKLNVTIPLLKNSGKSGERFVKVSQSGKSAETFFRRISKFSHSTLVEASPKTGRTHQIRVHSAWLGHPILGDIRYGHEDDNAIFKKRGYKGMCLHAQQLKFIHPVSGEVLSIKAELSAEFSDLVAKGY